MNPSKTTQDFIALGGALIFTMRPFRTVQTNIIVSDMESILGKPVGDGWTIDQHAFCLMVGATVDVKCADDTHIEALSVAEYWEQVKHAPTVTKWACYLNSISTEADMAWWQAYQATRRKPTTPAPDILQAGEPTDPNVIRSGGEPTA